MVGFLDGMGKPLSIDDNDRMCEFLISFSPFSIQKKLRARYCRQTSVLMRVQVQAFSSTQIQIDRTSGDHIS